MYAFITPRYQIKLSNQSPLLYCQMQALLLIRDRGKLTAFTHTRTELCMPLLLIYRMKLSNHSPLLYCQIQALAHQG